MNGIILHSILGGIRTENGGGTVVLNTKSGASYTFEISNEDRQYSFDDNANKIEVIRLETETGTKWVDVSSIESIEI